MLSYILFNTLIYGSIAFVLGSYFAYAKYLNLAISSFMIFAVYILASHAHYGWGAKQVGTLLFSLLLYRSINYIILHYFKNEKQRDLFGFIFTFGCSLLLDNSAAIFYGSSPASLEGKPLSRIGLTAILITMHVLIGYMFQKSYLGKIRQGMYSNVGSIRTLGISVYTMLHTLFFGFFIGMIGLAFLIAQQGAIKPSDNLFYTLKGIGIMILVGIEKRQYIYVGALLYVILEYVLFIVRGLPLGYKEALILVLILILLLFKPEGLFSFKQRAL